MVASLIIVPNGGKILLPKKNHPWIVYRNMFTLWKATEK